MTSFSGGTDGRPFLSTSAPRGREFDALAELFLGDADSTPDVIPFPREAPKDEPAREPETIAAPVATSSTAARGEVTIEALLMGHLPVRSGPWALQYAASSARHEGMGVALARLSPGEGAASRVSLELMGSHPAWSSDQANTLADAIGVAARSTGHWIIMVSELDEASVASIEGIDRVTVLSGANDAAVVDAYRMLKSIASSEGETPDAARPTVRVAIMGADGERAEASARKVQQGARTFLNMDVEIGLGLGKMGPTGAMSLYRGAAEITANELVRMIREPARQTTPPPMANVAPVRLAEAKLPVKGLATSSLAALVAGLRGLDIECPAAPEVQLAADDRGGLHVLADGDGAAQALAQAAGWAALHRSMIARATGVKLSDGAVAQHLFTRDVRGVRWMLDGSVRLHLITQAQARGETITVACALNEGSTQR